MKSGIIAGLLAACIAISVYLMWGEKPASPPVAQVEPPPALASSPAPPVPPAPLVLSEVVEVTDLNPLLDPPAKSESGVPFDAEPASAPVSTPVAPPRIPPAVD